MEADSSFGQALVNKATASCVQEQYQGFAAM